MSRSADSTKVEPSCRVTVRTVLVPVDGSPESSRALPLARWLAHATGADIRCIAVSAPGEDLSDMRAQVDAVNSSEGVQAHLLPGDDVAAAIVALAASMPHTTICMMSHGRGRTAAVMGSVSGSVAAQTHAPMFVVGPQVAPSGSLDAPIVACVDGSPFSEAVLPVAVGWANVLGIDLSIVTVAEPMPEPLDARTHYYRSHGPDVDADEYVATLVARCKGLTGAVDGRVVYDPVSVSSGMAADLERYPASFIAATTHARTGFKGLVLGSTAARLVRHLPVPVLLVPPVGFGVASMEGVHP